jgi:hypothetical protein
MASALSANNTPVAVAQADGKSVAKQLQSKLMSLMVRPSARPQGPSPRQASQSQGHTRLLFQGFSKGVGLGGRRCCPCRVASWSSTYTTDFTPLPSGFGRVSSS